MDLEGIMLSEISQAENVRYLYDFTYMWNLKNKTNSLIDTENKLVVARGKTGQGRQTK